MEVTPMFGGHSGANGAVPIIVNPNENSTSSKV